MNKLENQKEYFKHFAKKYDDALNRSNSNHLYKIEQIEKSIFTFTEKKNNYDILEIGAGTGIHAEYLLAQNNDKINKLALVDISQEMLNQAMNRLGNNKKVEYFVMSAEELTLPSFFDAIFMTASMHHFQNVEKSLFQMKKHLNPSGIMVICEPIVYNPLNFIRALIHIKGDYGQFYVTRKNVSQLLKNVGFEIIQNRVLHYRFSSNFLQILYPYEDISKYKIFDNLGIMYLITAKIKK